MVTFYHSVIWAVFSLKCFSKRESKVDEAARKADKAVQNLKAQLQAGTVCKIMVIIRSFFSAQLKSCQEKLSNMLLTLPVHVWCKNYSKRCNTASYFNPSFICGNVIWMFLSVIVAIKKYCSTSYLRVAKVLKWPPIHKVKEQLHENEAEECTKLTRGKSFCKT